MMDTLAALTIVQKAALIPLFPLIAAVLITLLGGKVLKGLSHLPAIAGVLASFIVAVSLLMSYNASDGGLSYGNVFTWFGAGGFHVPVGVYVDSLSILFVCFVTGISTLIFIYSGGYMAGDYGYFRFFAYLSIFVFFMCMLVLANNFVLVYLGWEGVGLASYLLVGYYYPKPSAREAAKKAFIVNRIGDTCFAIAIFIIYLTFHTVSFHGVLGDPHRLLSGSWRAAHHTAIFWIPLLLMVAAFAKSAQLPLHVWLPDAMEGPTPVSALIHAATMVTAGVYLVARCMPLFQHDLPVLHTVGIIGCITAFMAATIGMCQYDLKRIWAYSTVSQLGYMFLGLGVAAGSAAVFHVFTHAFFKALLFLATGSVMHAMGGELDIRKMSGIRRVMPITTVCLLMGAFALAGIPPWAGFFSKDAILSSAMNATWSWGPALSIVGLLTALITAYYTFRAVFRVFFGPLVLPATAGMHEPSAFTITDAHGAEHNGHDHAHDDAHAHAGKPTDGSPMMWLPLVILAIGATTVGFMGVFGGHGHEGGLMRRFLAGNDLNPAVQTSTVGVAGIPVTHVEQSMRVAPNVLMGISAALGVLGLLIAYYFHLAKRDAAEAAAARFRPLVKFLENKWYFDELYDLGLVQPLWAFGWLLSYFDRFVVDGLVFVVSFVPQLAGFSIKPTESGRLRYYGIGMVAGIAVVVLGVLYLMH